MSLARDTEVLTSRGWLPYTEVRTGKDRAISYNYFTRRLDWAIIDEVYEHIDTDILLLTNGAWRMRATPTQMWYTEEGSVVSVDVTKDTELLVSAPTENYILLPSIANHRRYVTNLTWEPAGQDTVVNIVSANSSWYARQGNNIALVGSSL